MPLDFLGDADEMYHRFLDRWCHEDDRRKKTFPASRPDMLTIDDFEGETVADFCELKPGFAEKTMDMIATMLLAAEADWPNYLHVTLPISQDWLKAFDDYYTDEALQAVLDRSDPSEFDNDYLIILCELGVVIGQLFMEARLSLRWLPDWPYWESSIYCNQTGTIIPVFHWALKRMSTYGKDDELLGKLQTALHVMNDVHNETPPS